MPYVFHGKRINVGIHLFTHALQWQELFEAKHCPTQSVHASG